MSEVTRFTPEHSSVTNDVDAAHARLRAHQATLESINSRVDVNERRVDRIEQRVDDQSAVLAELNSTTHATEAAVKTQTSMTERAAERIEAMIDRLNKHIALEAEQDKEQTRSMERLHRTLIRATTALVVIGVLLAAAAKQINIIDAIKMAIGG